MTHQQKIINELVQLREMERLVYTAHTKRHLLIRDIILNDNFIEDKEAFLKRFLPKVIQFEKQLLSYTITSSDKVVAKAFKKHNDEMVYLLYNTYDYRIKFKFIDGSVSEQTSFPRKGIVIFGQKEDFSFINNTVTDKKKRKDVSKFSIFISENFNILWL